MIANFDIIKLLSYCRLFFILYIWIKQIQYIYCKINLNNLLLIDYKLNNRYDWKISNNQVLNMKKIMWFKFDYEFNLWIQVVNINFIGSDTKIRKANNFIKSLTKNYLENVFKQTKNFEINKKFKNI